MAEERQLQAPFSLFRSLPSQDEVARRAAEALTSLSGTQYRVGSIFTTVCKYTLHLFII